MKRLLLVRLSLLLLGVLLAFAVGAWLKGPGSALSRPGAVERDRFDSAAALRAASAPDGAASEITHRDPFGLNTALSAATAAQAADPSASSPDAAEWRLAALSASPNERWLLLSAPGQVPMRFSEGQRLPNGERIHRITSQHVLLQDRRGRQRTLYLTEP